MTDISFFINEKRSLSQYREQKLKKDLNYDKSTNEVDIDGRKFKLSKTNGKRRDMLSISLSPVSGSTINYTDDALRLKRSKSLKAAIHHEIGHQTERDHWDTVYSDVISSSEKYLQRIKNDDSKKDVYKKIEGIIDSSVMPSETKDAPRTLHVLIRKLSEAGVPDLKKYNSEIRDFDKNVVIPTYKKYGVKGSHGKTLEEYHADLHASNKVGTKVMKNAIKDVESSDRRSANKYSLKNYKGELSNEMKARRKVIKDNAKLLSDEAMKKESVDYKLLIYEYEMNGLITSDECKLLIQGV